MQRVDESKSPAESRIGFLDSSPSSELRLLFLVNGSRTSPAADRAHAFAERLPIAWQVRTQYRPARKWAGIAPFVRAALALRPDVIYVMDTAYTGVLAGRIARRLTGCRLIVDTGDVGYEQARSLGTYSRTQLALIRWVERLAMRGSDGVIVRGSFHRDLLASQGVRRCLFVPDGVDMARFGPSDESALKRKLGLDGCFVIGMIGTMVWSDLYRICYGWDIVEALGLLRDLPVKALLIGDGEGEGHLKARAAELGVTDRIVFAGRQPFETLPQFISAMDVCVSTQSNDIVGQVRTTGKLPLYLACNRYVISTDVGEASRVLPEVGCLLPYEGVRDDSHPIRLAEHIRSLIDTPAMLSVSQGARSVAAAEFDYDLLARRVARFCLELVDVPAGRKRNRLGVMEEIR